MWPASCEHANHSSAILHGLISLFKCHSLILLTHVCALRALRLIGSFRRREELGGNHVHISVSMLEIKEEKLKDLLAAGSASQQGLKIRGTETSGRTYVSGLSKHAINVCVAAAQHLTFVRARLQIRL